MPTRGAVVVLAMTLIGLAGCQGDKPVATQPVAVQPTGTQSTDAQPTDAQPTATPSAATSSTAAAAADNGVAKLDADEILLRAKAALKKAKSFRVKGAATEDGQPSKISLEVDGKDFIGSLTMGKAKLDILAVGGNGYIRANERFWVQSTSAEQGKAMAQIIGDRWVTGADKDQGFKELFSIGSVDELLKSVGPLSKVAKKEIAGVPAIGLKDAGDGNSVLYVATTGKPYPLRSVDKGGEVVTLSAFGEKFTTIKAPPAKEVVDLGKLGGK